MTDFIPFDRPRIGKTSQSATLRKEAGQNEKMVDELEPGYPLEVYGYCRVSGYKWYRVKAIKKPPRDKDQWGWIYSPLVAFDAPKPSPTPDFDPGDYLLRVPEWRVVAAAAALIAGGVLVWLLI